MGKNDRILKALGFFRRAEGANQWFSIDDIVEATGFTRGVVRTRISKIWHPFLTRLGEQFICRGALKVADAEFVAMHSQKAAVPPSLQVGLPGAPLPSRYTAAEELGQGAYGVVFRCRDAVLRRDVAVKVLFPHHNLNETATASIAKEVAAVRLIGPHKHILRIHDFGTHIKTRYISMDIARGGSLRDLLKSRGTLPEAECRRIGAQIAHGLAAAHASKVIHRDVKPDNVLFDADGTVLLADFGLATIIEESSQTMSTTFGAGTPAYKSPEVRSGRKARRASDMFSLGLVLFEMATGRCPKIDNRLRFKVAGPPTKVAPAIASVSPGFSPEFESVVRHLLVVSASLRTMTAPDCAAALDPRNLVIRPGAPDPNSEE